jgi:hypothetical protein
MVIVRVGKFCALAVWTPMQAMESTARTKGNRMVTLHPTSNLRQGAVSGRTHRPVILPVWQLTALGYISRQERGRGSRQTER